MIINKIYYGKGSTKMKKRFIFLFIAICISICIFLVMHDSMELESNNEVFTDEFFTGVESAYMTSNIADSDEIKGWRLRRYNGIF